MGKKEWNKKHYLKNKDKIKQQVRDREDKFYLDGACCKCGSTNKDPNKSLCYKCAKNAADYHRKKRYKNKVKGVCIDCGKPLTHNDTDRCILCYTHTRSPRISRFVRLKKEIV